MYVARSVGWFIVDHNSVGVAQALPNKHQNIVEYCLKGYNMQVAYTCTLYFVRLLL